MKQFGKWLMAATLLCSLSALTSCDEDQRDNPANYDSSEEVIRNREEVLSHVKSDAKVLAGNMNPEMFNLTNQVYSQLMALMVKDRNYMRNMKQVLAIMAANSALKKIRPVTYGSELAKMGYLMYIPVDIQTFGTQVVFDENGESRLFPCDGLEFIFPATVDGLGTTLYKVAFKAGDNWTEKIFPAQLNNVKGLACVYRVPKTLTMTLSGAFDNKVLTLSQTTFDIGETQVSGQVSTSLKGVGYGLPDVESSLNFQVGLMEDGKVSLGFGYQNNGRNIMTVAAQMALPKTGNFIELLSGLDMKGVSTDLDIQILGDLRLYGQISDAKQFSEAFTDVLKNHQDNQVSVRQFSDMIDRCNASANIYLTCQHAVQPLIIRLLSDWENNTNLFMPAVWSYESFDLIPFSALMGQGDVDNIYKAIYLMVPPVSAEILSIMQLYSRIMQMLPLNSAEWGL